ncbi:MAG: PhoH family protein [Acholeplasmatales bacterium]|nr:PhoH family protein [Acholeplasmatales bacterium]
MKLDVLIERDYEIKNIIGCQNSNLKALESMFDCKIDIRGNEIITDLEDQLKINKLTEIFKILLELCDKGLNINSRDIIYINNIIDEGKVNEYLDFLSKRKAICHTSFNKPIYAKTLKQGEYIDAIKKKDLIFSIGAAGTGKTYLAVCYAVNELKKGNVKKIILTRPAVEAGESLGFLPGDLKEKVDPYLRPLYDALNDMLGSDNTQTYIDKDIIEIAPLAYMRGRTLDDAIIILDEAQNASVDQLKMFLTRMGFNSKMIVTGDISQIDLPNPKKSGLKISSTILKDLDEVGVIVFERYDVVRHPIVGKIIEKFEQLDN